MQSAFAKLIKLCEITNPQSKEAKLINQSMRICYILCCKQRIFTDKILKCIWKLKTFIDVIQIHLKHTNEVLKKIKTIYYAKL